MKSLFSAAMLVIFTFGMLGISGCDKGASVEDICAKVAEGEEVAECVEELTAELEECTNKDAVVECMSTAETEYAIEGCFNTCERAEGGGEGE